MGKVEERRECRCDPRKGETDAGAQKNETKPKRSDFSYSGSGGISSLSARRGEVAERKILTGKFRTGQEMGERN